MRLPVVEIQMSAFGQSQLSILSGQNLSAKKVRPSRPISSTGVPSDTLSVNLKIDAEVD